MHIFRLTEYEMTLPKDSRLSLQEISRANKISGQTITNWIKKGLFPKPEWHYRLSSSRKPTRYWRLDVLLPLLGKEFPFGREEWKDNG